jgi:hypothetical protein
MATFAGGGRVVEAVQFNGQNLHDVAAWVNVEDEELEIKGYYTGGNTATILFPDKSSVVIEPGEWLVHRSGKFMTMSASRFQVTYHYIPMDEDTDETPPQFVREVLPNSAVVGKRTEFIWLALGALGGALTTNIIYVLVS